MLAIVKRSLFVVTLLGLTAALSVALVEPAVAGPPNEATMVFGKTLGERPPTTRPCNEDPAPGKPSCFPGDHDASAHAADSITPRTVVISAGGKVNFDLAGIHGVGVLPAGAGLADVAAGSKGFSGCPGGPAGYITNGLIFEGAPPCSGAGDTSFTFTEPGRYLVICTFQPHFREADMYSWVIVK